MSISTQSNKKTRLTKPIHISDALANFIGIEPNTLISKVDATKFICDYIHKNNLIDNQSIRYNIVPDIALQNLLGCNNKNIDLIILGKYMDKHFFDNK